MNPQASTMQCLLLFVAAMQAEGGFSYQSCLLQVFLSVSLGPCHAPKHYKDTYAKPVIGNIAGASALNPLKL